MLESALENKLRTAVKQHGGLALKFVSPGLVGVPDRLIILPGGRYGFVEVKQLDQKPRPNQIRRHKQLQRLGCQVHLLDRPSQIPGIIHEIQTA